MKNINRFNIKGGENYKQLVENKYGIPNKYSLNELLKSTFKLYPLNHSFDTNAIQKFINAADPEVRDICRKLINNTDHISFELFLARLNDNIYDLVLQLKNKKVYIFFDDVFELDSIQNKSNYWIYLYIKEYIKYITNDLVEVIIITGFNNPFETDDYIVLVDDCIYSGNQMGITLSSIYNISKKNLNFYILVPFITDKGLKHLLNMFKENIYLSKCNLYFSKYIYKPKIIEDVLNKEEILLIDSYYKKFDYKFYISFSQKALIYFDHKLADKVSTITPFYLGIVPSKLNITKVNEYKDLLSEKNNNIFNFLIIIPLFKNCNNYIQDINLMNPKCPTPPYKTDFIDFIKQIKKEKKYRSL